MRHHSKISETLSALERAWKKIRAEYPEVPQVAIYIASGEGKKYGHFGGGDRWIARDGEAGGSNLSEVLIAGEGLRRGGRATFGTLIHEAVHAASAALGIKDHSREGRYHNAKFRQRAENMGMTVTEEKPHGWCRTAITDETASMFASSIDDIDAAIVLYMRDLSGKMPKAGGDEDEDDDSEKEAKPAPKGRLLKAMCSCERVIRVSRKVIDGAPIVCGVCLAPFVASEG